MNYFLSGYVLLEPNNSFKDKKSRYIIDYETDTILPGSHAISWTEPSNEQIKEICDKYKLSNTDFKNLQGATDHLYNEGRIFSIQILNVIVFKNRNDATEIFNKYFSKNQNNDVKLFGIYLPAEYYQKILTENFSEMIKMVKQKIEMQNDEKVIGFDVVNCIKFGENLRFAFSEAIKCKIEENDYGLLKSYSDCKKLIENTDFEYIHNTVVTLLDGKYTPSGDNIIDHWIPWLFTEVVI